MADQQHLALVGGQPGEIVDAAMEQGMPGPIVVREGNGGRANIYMEAPQFHWQHLQIHGEDPQARHGVQQLAHECHDFGQEVHRKLALLDAAYAPLQPVPEDIAALKARMDQVEPMNRQRDEREEG